MSKSNKNRAGIAGWIILALLMGVAGYFFGLRVSGPDAAAAAERTVLYWQAPMNPEEIYDSPGQSAMGMDLVPVYADKQPATSDSNISIDPSTVQNMGVRTQIVDQRDFSRQIRTVGDVSYNEERLHIVNSRVSGWIEKLYVSFVGEEVRAGSPLMDIYSPELVSTQEEFLLAVRNAELVSLSATPSVRADAERLVAAARTRLEYWDIPESEIEALAQTGEVRKTIRINAPATGIVTERNTIEGAFIQRGEDLFRIADLRTVWVHASFFDDEVPWISVGQRVEMTLSYLPGKSYVGTVDFIYPYLREKARDVHVRLVFDNSASYELKPGMYANILLQGRAIKNAVVVPTEALIRSGSRTMAFVALGEGRFEPREVETAEVGGDNNAQTRILSGLSAGELVVVSAQFLLDSESRLQEAIRKMLASGESAGPVEEAAHDHEVGMEMPAEPEVPHVHQMAPGQVMPATEMPADSVAISHDHHMEHGA
ncbi:MAG: RND family efflux transporter MFP subunit [Rhodothermales bacterium]|jgi:RND family efflux transporter MFP subunit